jgi:hypothetical protein
MILDVVIYYTQMRWARRTQVKIGSTVATP